MKRATSGSPYEAEYGFSRAVRRGNRILVAGSAPIDPNGGPSPTSAYDQMHRCAAIALQAMSDLGGTAADVVRTRMFITDAADAGAVGRAHRECFGEAAPAATMVVVAGLLDPAWKVELEIEAVVDC
jgi:enamine deaminase RidA (YjgF/YER057c/UK114 family)